MIKKLLILLIVVAVIYFAVMLLVKLDVLGSRQGRYMISGFGDKYPFAYVVDRKTGRLWQCSVTGEWDDMGYPPGLDGRDDRSIVDVLVSPIF